MNRFDGIIICTDLDGTLLNNRSEVSRENLEAIEYFKAHGGHFTFVTGRMPYFVGGVLKRVTPNAPIGCINGGGLYDLEKKKYVCRSELDSSSLELVKYINEKFPEVAIQINGFEKIYFTGDNKANMEFRRASGVAYFEKHYTEVDVPIAKIVFAIDEEDTLLEIERLLLAHPLGETVSLLRSCETLYEILPKGAAKGSVLAPLADYLGSDISKTIAVGDYNNDISMIEAAGVGIAVENACDALKEVADLVTVSNEESAIAKIISDIECGKIKV